MLTGRLVFSREALAPRQCSSTPEKVTGVKEADVSSANQEAVTKYDSDPAKVEDLIKIKVGTSGFAVLLGSHRYFGETVKQRITSLVLSITR